MKLRSKSDVAYLQMSSAHYQEDGMLDRQSDDRLALPLIDLDFFTPENSDCTSLLKCTFALWVINQMINYVDGGKSAALC